MPGYTLGYAAVVGRRVGLLGYNGGFAGVGFHTLDVRAEEKGKVGKISL